MRELLSLLFLGYRHPPRKCKCTLCGDDKDDEMYIHLTVNRMGINNSGIVILCEFCRRWFFQETSPPRSKPLEMRD